MAEGCAASILLFDTLSEIGLVSGSGPSALMSLKPDSAVALKPLRAQSVTVRTHTAAQNRDRYASKHAESKIYSQSVCLWILRRSVL